MAVGVRPTRPVTGRRLDPLPGRAATITLKRSDVIMDHYPVLQAGDFGDAGPPAVPPTAPARGGGLDAARDVEWEDYWKSWRADG